MPISATKNKMAINTYKILFVPAGCEKDSAVNMQLALSSMKILAHFTCFLTGGGFSSFLFDFQFLNTDNSPSTHARVTSSLTEGTWYQVISIKNRVLVSQRGVIQPCCSESPLAMC